LTKVANALNAATHAKPEPNAAAAPVEERSAPVTTDPVDQPTS